MADRLRQLAPHIVAMAVLYVFFVVVAAVVFGYGDVWAALSIAVAIAFGYKPTVVALGIGPEVWNEEIRSRDG